MENPKDQIVERLNQATNVLVTVSANPSVDQLAGAIGITLLLNKLGKHATAVFSGQVPSTLQFLQPDKTLEKNTDSLRDFIIALDKSKADKLRYKVEDQMVKIFITPYRTSITNKDLEFSQGDFNVEVVLALGVDKQEHLDQAITSHGRILHDATVVSVSTKVNGTALGALNLVQPDASSLSEILVDLGLALKADVLDAQMATAFLTGIVAETERFGNEKTSSRTMQMSAKLMAAGANQQLVATQLEPPEPKPEPAAKTSKPIAKSDASEADVELPEVKPDNETDTKAAPAPKPVVEKKPEPPKPAADGTLEIDHGDPQPTVQSGTSAEEDKYDKETSQIVIDDEGLLKQIDKETVAPPKPADTAPAEPSQPSRFILEPPVMGGTLTANSVPEGMDPSTDPLGPSSNDTPLLSHYSPPANTAASTAAPASNTPTAPVVAAPSVEDIIGSSSDTSTAPADTPSEPATSSAQDNSSGTDLNSARNAVEEAVKGTAPQILEPVQSLNANPIDLNPPASPITPDSTPTPAPAPVSDQPAPPTVPPPMMPPVMPPSSSPMADPNSPNNTAL